MDRNHPTNPNLDSLPDHFEPALVALDRRVAHQAALDRASMPREVADAVYDMTVGLLVPRYEPIKIETARMARQVAWGRFAMAAALGMAFVVTAMALRVPLQAETMPLAGVLPPSVEQVLLEPSSFGGIDQGYLLDTRDVTFNDLSGDMEQLLRDLEM